MVDDSRSRSRGPSYHLLLHPSLCCRRDGHEEMEQSDYRGYRFLYWSRTWLSHTQCHHWLLQVIRACPLGRLFLFPYHTTFLEVMDNEKMVEGSKEKSMVTVVLAKQTLRNRRGEGYVDTGIKILIAVVLGALLLTGLYLLFNGTILPTLTQRIKDMFNYKG